jgi:hypothetical protein
VEQPPDGPTSTEGDRQQLKGDTEKGAEISLRLIASFRQATVETPSIAKAVASAASVALAGVRQYREEATWGKWSATAPDVPSWSSSTFQCNDIQKDSF